MYLHSLLPELVASLSEPVGSHRLGLLAKLSSECLAFGGQRERYINFCDGDVVRECR